MGTIFRPYSSSDALRSDRSAGDRQRHRQKLRKAIRENIADIVAEESIIGQSRDKIVKVPIRGVREYRFVFGENTPGVGTGDGTTEPGQVVGKAGDRSQPGPGPAGDQPGVDYYEMDVSLDELINIMFDDLELPELERKRLNQIKAEALRKRKGYRRAGVRVHLDKRRTAIARVRRKLARHGPPVLDSEGTEEARERFPYRWEDMRYRRLQTRERPQSNAVVLCIMDTSGSMDTMKKYLARAFFFLLYQFIRTRYAQAEVVFVAHDTNAREVTEDEFFTKGESGGTTISSGYQKALEIIRERYHPELWNIYAFHCSDGDNFTSDNEATLKAAQELCESCNLFGYGEIRPTTPQGLFGGFSSGSMKKVFEQLDETNFESVSITDRDEVWPAFQKFLRREEAAA